ncbi:L-rhamnose mutarotase [Niabella pedocola]|uniref:L-rhamnose mutarotase n=1 Tax=Niabella pedocola TaxID=1752077 RepID=A0ABS8PXU4_9BACT|nr:L-rhamnose mutarotase [Niabella pedocola]MCD2425892.1 L-rhamnose mutarotase [Niabella pedocola]
MKRLYIALITIFFASLAGTAQVYIAPGGNDAAAGTASAPKATLRAAIRQLREQRRLQPGSNSNILLKSGTYYLNELVYIRPEDSGTPGSPLVIAAAPGATPVLSGGILIKDWKKPSGPVKGLPDAAQGKVWVADLPVTAGNAPLRQLWVNNKKAVRAKSTTGNSMQRILNWDKKTATAVIPLHPFERLEVTAGLEFFIHQWWEVARLRVRKLEKAGDSCRVWFYEPESRIQNEHPWPAPWLSAETGNSAFYLSNALAFLDEPGEWYADAASRKLYYYPRPQEEMNIAETAVPLLEHLLVINGTPEHPVENIVIKGLAFRHSAWNRPSWQGHVPHQAGLYMTEAYKLKPAGTPEKPSLDNQAWVGRPEAAVTVSYANNLRFEDSRFEHLAATGLDLRIGVKAAAVTGSLFKEIGGTAIQGGYFGDDGAEIHKPYNPADPRVICENITLANNLITDAGNEDWGCVAIGMGFSRFITIEKNEIENVPYSGISMGWGWTPLKNIMADNRIRYNKIHHYGRTNYDCAGIYTLSAQPGTVIEENYIDSIYKAPYAHLPTHWFYLYTDEGSSGITIRNNWTPAQKYLQNNNGPGNWWNNNGPQVAAAIKNNAGLENNYRLLLRKKTSGAVHQEINRQRKELIELVNNTGSPVDLKKLKILLQEKGVQQQTIGQWKEHTVVYGLITDVNVLRGQLQKAFPDVTIHVYQDMVYEFDRAARCAAADVAANWTDIIMTANLVKDPAKQQAYLDYHATQFDVWPEVSNGFCKADFQQLRVFKNGRQLMLVISIPKGKTLDELNPKTTENNPRVLEWNRIMSGYQEGIDGTKNGETWVEFSGE